jgi:hypothetical protein
MWQKETAEIPGDDDDLATWDEAVDFCEHLEFAGRSDWRLPNVRELVSIVNYGPDGPAFPFFTVWGPHWASTSVQPHPDHDAYQVLFGSKGTIHDGDSKAGEYYVLCVRSADTGGGLLPATGQTVSVRDGDDGFHQSGCPSSNRFADNGDGTVTDNCTELMWQQATADIPGDDDDLVTWAESVDYGENLDFAGYSDWRLPNVRELHSIVDYGRFYPAIDPVFQIQGGPLDHDGAWHWTSTMVDEDDGWHVGFWIGTVHPGRDNPTLPWLYYVRAVRSIATSQHP